MSFSKPPLQPHVHQLRQGSIFSGAYTIGLVHKKQLTYGAQIQARGEGKGETGVDKQGRASREGHERQAAIDKGVYLVGTH